jgi:hypothetical protein
MKELNQKQNKNPIDFEKSRNFSFFFFFFVVVVVVVTYNI